MLAFLAEGRPDVVFVTLEAPEWSGRAMFGLAELWPNDIFDIDGIWKIDGPYSLISGIHVAIACSLTLV